MRLAYCPGIPEEISTQDECVNPIKSALVYPNPVRDDNVKITIENVGTNVKSINKPELEIQIFNIKGQVIRKSTDFQITKGQNTYIWDKKDEKNQLVPSGVYLYKIISDNDIMTGKLLILK
jgi:flagellar hook assembly protein FlgD